MKITCQKTTEITMNPETFIFERSTANAPNQTVPSANVKISQCFLDNRGSYHDTHHGICSSIFHEWNLHVNRLKDAQWA